MSLLSGSQSQNGGQKRGLARLTLTVVVELLNAAIAASTVRVILPTLLFPLASFSIYTYLNNPFFLFFLFLYLSLAYFLLFV
jgi:hypothetical protein